MKTWYKKLILFIFTFFTKDVYEMRKHYSLHGFKFTNEVSGTASIHCTSNYNQINKIVGISAGLNHHKNSIRIGWWGKDLYAYWYKNGERGWDKLTTIKGGEEFTFKVSITKGDYYIKVNNVSWISLSGQHSTDSVFHHVLFPYFGGQTDAKDLEECHVKLKFD